MPNYMRDIAPFWPSLSQIAVLCVIFYGIWHKWIPQISDIFNTNSAAEIPQKNVLLHWPSITLRPKITLRLVPFRITLNYVLIVSLFAAIIGFLLSLLIYYNVLQRRHYIAALSSHGTLPLNFQLTNAERPAIFKRLDGGTPGPSAYHWLIVWTESLILAPLVFGVVLMRWKERHYPAYRLNYHGLALIGTFSLLGLIDIAIAEWRLAILSGFGLGETLLPFTPLVYLVLLLFAPYAWTERGKGILNDDRTDWPAPDRLPEPNPTLDFLEHPPAPRKSLSEDESPGNLPQRKSTHDGPVVIFCLAGGGSRAALYAAGILSRMWWQTALFDESWKRDTAMLPAADRLRLNVSTAPNASQGTLLYPGRLLLQYADVISSVSGGSLAAGYFLESLLRDIRDVQNNTTDARAGRYAALDRFFAPTWLTSETTHPPIRWYDAPVLPDSLRDFFRDPTLAYRSDAIERDEQKQKAFEANPFINAMQQDHLAAIMCGFFRFRERGRGPGLERYWEQMYRWFRPPADNDKSPIVSVRIRDFFDLERSAHLPALILNATLARTGTRLAITNLDAAEFQETYKFGPIVDGRDLGEGDIFSTAALRRSMRPDVLFGNRSEAISEAAQRRFDPLPAQINTLNELDSRWNISLARAVHASANFPFGFPLMRFVRRTTDATINNPNASEIKFQGGRDILEIADGGLNRQYRSGLGPRADSRQPGLPENAGRPDFPDRQR